MTGDEGFLMVLLGVVVVAMLGLGLLVNTAMSDFDMAARMLGL